ncbi:HRDC domain-containing protein [Photobacterium sanguinicancri]|uniref:HRDC domain-containing protein n=1 Tax=Photobacterium sanguinicancri TaxID=875932 RepID=UPI002405DE22|nr:HRDC domain-containing protein [Photobacterium sanguinicancri]
MRELRNSKPKRESKSSQTIDLSAADTAQFEALKDVRSSLARAQNVPAYIICHDASLKAIAKNRPQTLEQLSQISGFGESKISKYGEQLLAIVNSNSLS